MICTLREIQRVDADYKTHTFAFILLLPIALKSKCTKFVDRTLCIALLLVSIRYLVVGIYVVKIFHADKGADIKQACLGFNAADILLEIVICK